MREVSLERYYVVLDNDALTLKISKMALNPFCEKRQKQLFIYVTIFYQRQTSHFIFFFTLHDILAPLFI